MKQKKIKPGYYCDLFNNLAIVYSCELKNKDVWVLNADVVKQEINTLDQFNAENILMWTYLGPL
jgi:hypothetical protein